jgi:hypothetical protein
MSLAGSPERAGILDFSSRGLAELAYDSNDIALILDDTEKAEDAPGVFVKALKAVVHMVPGGRSKMISRAVDQNRFPQLRWSTMGLTSSPQPIPELAAQKGWVMTPGDNVRLFDIAVPGPSKGGIFDLVSGGRKKRAKRSVKLIGKLARGYSRNHGHTIPQWVIYLMQKNRSREIVGFIDKFITHVNAGGQGWEVRFARKFALVYAALLVAIDSGILPWSRQLVLKAVTKCYRKARRAAKTTEERVDEAVTKLRRSLMEAGSVIDVASNSKKTPLVLPEDCLGIRYEKDGRTVLGLFDSALETICGHKKLKAAFIRRLTEAGILISSSGASGTVQERIPIKRNATLIERPRLRLANAEALKDRKRGTEKLRRSRARRRKVLT